MLTSRSEQRRERAGSVAEVDKSDSDSEDADGDAAIEAEAVAVERRDDAKGAAAEQKHDFAMCQIVKICAKQATQKLRQRYKRAPQYPMHLSGVDPYTGIARPATDYLCLAPPAHAPAEIAAARPDEHDDSDADSDSENADDDDSAEVNPDELPDSDAKADGDAKSDAKAVGDEKEPVIARELSDENGKDEKKDHQPIAPVRP
jgi:hypothetical protein